MLKSHTYLLNKHQLCKKSSINIDKTFISIKFYSYHQDLFTFRGNKIMIKIYFNVNKNLYQSETIVQNLLNDYSIVYV